MSGFLFICALCISLPTHLPRLPRSCCMNPPFSYLSYYALIKAALSLQLRERHGGYAGSGVGARRPSHTLPPSFLHSTRPCPGPRHRRPLPRPPPTLSHLAVGGVDMLRRRYRCTYVRGSASRHSRPNFELRDKGRVTPRDGTLVLAWRDGGVRQRRRTRSTTTPPSWSTPRPPYRAGAGAFTTHLNPVFDGPTAVTNARPLHTQRACLRHPPWPALLDADAPRALRRPQPSPRPLPFL